MSKILSVIILFISIIGLYFSIKAENLFLIIVNGTILFIQSVSLSIAEVLKELKEND
jgi:hypothetical protein